MGLLQFWNDFRSQDSDVSIKIASKLLGIDEAQMRHWLCNRKIVTATETLIKPLTVAQVNNSRVECMQLDWMDSLRTVLATFRRRLQSERKKNEVLFLFVLPGAVYCCWNFLIAFLILCARGKRVEQKPVEAHWRQFRSLLQYTESESSFSETRTENQLPAQSNDVSFLLSTWIIPKSFDWLLSSSLKSNQIRE